MHSITLNSREVYARGVEGDSIYGGADYACRDKSVLLGSLSSEALRFIAPGQPQYMVRKVVWQRSTDNGRTWQELDKWEVDRADTTSDRRMSLGFFFLPGPNVVVGRSIIPSGFPIANFTLKRSFFRYSRDAGLTWGDWRQAVDSRPGFDATNWAPGIVVGELGGVCDGQPVLEDDNTVLMGFTIREPHAPPEDISARAREISSFLICGRGVWNERRGELDWTFGEAIRVPFPIACGGCCEPAMARLSRDRWMMTMRCQGDPTLKIPSRRMAAISHDGGRTWSAPTELLYDDNTPVWMPASFHRFFVSSKTGRTYLIGNFLPGPVYGQTPRYPLAMAELDTERNVILRDTLFVIQDLPPDAPIDRRYTNFGLYEDCASGELVLLLPEHPLHKNYAEMTDPSDYTGDCLIYRIGFGNG